MAVNAPELEVAIRAAIEHRVRQIAEEELKSAQERVSSRIRDDIARIIISSHAMYEIEFDRKRILITVKNEVG